MSKENIYKCWFHMIKFEDEISITGMGVVTMPGITPKIVLCSVDAGLSVLDIGSSGFWLNKDLEYTYGEDNVYWIPASQIVMIEKIGDSK